MLKKLMGLGAVSVLTLTVAANTWAAKTWTVNFKDSDIQEVIKFVADVTGRTVVIDPRVKGRVKVISAKPVTEEELIGLFRTVLEVHDFSVVEVGDVLRIIPLKDARSSPVPVVPRGSQEKGFLTQVIQLQNIAAAKVLPSIRPLVPQHSHLSAYDPSNAIIITDTAENIARIRDLIEMLDKSATPITEVIELKYADASDLVQVLNSLEKEEQNRRSPQNSINLTADKRNNAILLTGEDLQRQRIKNLIAKLDKPKSHSGNVRVVYLEYANAKTVSETLSKVMANLARLTPGAKAGGGDKGTAATVEADEETNSLLITASGDELETLMQVIARLDIRRRQVLVEAIIAEVGNTDSRDLGIQWLFRNTDKGVLGSSSLGDGSLATVGAGAIGGDPGNNDPAALTNLAGALASQVGQVLGVIGTNDDADFFGLLKALEEDQKTNILSTPTLLTMDNHEASFTVGQNIPILTGSSNTTGGAISPFQTFQREDVGIKLTLTPQINEGDTILLDIAQENSSIDQGLSSAQGLITKKRAIQTQVLAADGEIVVLGGLIQTDTTYNEQRVPVLGRLPLVGALFRTSGKSITHTNLMVFLKVTIIKDDETLSGATAEKYQYIRDQQIKQRDNGFLRMKHKAGVVLPDLTFQDLERPGAVENVIKTPTAREIEETVEDQQDRSRE